MFQLRGILLVSQVLIVSLLPLGWGANPTRNDSKCIFTDIEARLNVASQIIETTRQKLPKDLEELCRNTMNCPVCKNKTDYVKPMDCSDIFESGERKDGIYDIWPQNRMSQGPLGVYCDMESNGGGWTVIQRRGDYKSPQDYFYRDWNSYKLGFGDKHKDFWIGNDNLFVLTNQRSYHLRINLTDWEENSTYAIYDEFWVTDEAHNYTLHVNGYRGTAGDSLSTDNGSLFTTKDRKNDRFVENCAVRNQGAWWYRSCSLCNLNGLYFGNNSNSPDGKGVYWLRFRGSKYSLKEAVMKIRPAGFTVKSTD